MLNMKLKSYIEDRFAKHSDIVLLKQTIVDEFKSNKNEVLLKFEPNFKFLSLYYLLSISIPIEKIKIITTQPEYENLKDDIQSFEKCFTKVTITDDKPTYSTYTKSDFMMKKEKDDSIKAPFLDMFEYEVSMLDFFDNEFVFSNGGSFIKEEVIKRDLILRIIDYSETTIDDENLESILLRELVKVPKNYLTLEEIENFLKIL